MLDSINIKNDGLISSAKDTSVSKNWITDYAPRRIRHYILKPPSVAYKIVSFIVETEEGDFINQVSCTGDTISERAEQIILRRTNGTPVFFNCIKVRHPGGKIYTVNNLTIDSLIPAIWE